MQLPFDDRGKFVISLPKEEAMIAPATQYIEIRPNRDGQNRPYLIGTRTRVQDVVLLHERAGMSAEEIARALPHLSIAQVHAALLHYFEDRQAIWDCIREDEAYAERMRLKLTGDQSAQPKADAGSAAVSS
jgi:uncharacterized protein (DUF433 family)